MLGRIGGNWRTTMNFTRRQALKGIGMAGIVGGVSAFALSGSASAAMTSEITASNPGVVRNDDGNITEVYVVPKVYTEWRNFDEVPLKLRYILEAGIDGQGYSPVYRETPWLFTDNNDKLGTATHGTTDRFPDAGRVPLATGNSAFYNINGNGDFVSPDDGSVIVPPKIVLYKEGEGAYYDEPTDYDGHTGGSGMDHWTGASLGSDSGDYANGNYGVIGNTDMLDQDTDGDSKTTTIWLRFSTVLLDGASESLMQAEYPAYSGSAGYTYERLRNIAGSNPCVSVSETSFEISVENEPAEMGSNARANPGVN